LSSKQFQHGQSNPTYLLDVGGQRLVLRKQPPGKLLASAHAVDREYRVLAALAQAGENMPASSRQWGSCATALASMYCLLHCYLFHAWPAAELLSQLKGFLQTRFFTVHNTPYASPLKPVGPAACVLQAGKVAVPRPLCMCSDASVLGTPFYVMEFAAGTIFTNPNLPDVGPR
jgi:aminoglycoside phosphotransferase (APT) family kinase protein